MKTIRLALLSFATAIGSLVASAQQASTEAFVSSVTGSASVIAPGSTNAVPVVTGQKLPEGSTISTAEGSTVLIQSHLGIATGVASKSTVTIGAHSVSADGVRTAVIDLKQGTTVSVLDPTKRTINNYAVRTPKGVAAARGTTYSTTVTLSSGGEAIVTVNTLTGAVSFAIVGGATVSVTEGYSATSASTTSTSISSAIAAATPAQQADIAEALKATVTVASIVAQASTTTGDINAASTLQSVVTAVTTAANEVAVNNPTLGGTIVTNTVTSVQAFAGDSSATVVASIQSTATGSNATAANTAAANPVPAQTVTVSTNTEGTQTITPAPVDAPAATPATPATPDVTVIVSPAQ